MSTDPYYGEVPAFDAEQPTQPEMAPVASPSVVATDVAPTPRRTPDWRRLGVIGAVALVLVALVAGLAFAAMHNSATNATATAQGYCDAATRADYAKTYTYFAPSLASSLDASAYGQGTTALDTLQGKVTSCKLGKLTVAKDGKTATVPVVLTRKTVGAQSFTWQFAQGKSGVWQFTAAPEPAAVPLIFASLYCTEIAANKLPAAYALFTTNEQQSVGGVTQFTQDMTQTGQYLGALQKCQLQKITVSKDGTTSAVKLGIWFSNYPNVPAEIDTQVASNGTTQIDAVNLSAGPLTVPYPLPVTMLQQILQIFGSGSGTGSGSGQ